MQHSVDGLPKCKHCLRSLVGGQSFPTTSPITPALYCTPKPMKDSSMPHPLKPHLPRSREVHVEPPPVGLMADPSFVEIAKGPWKLLTAELRAKNELHHCPICNQWLAKPQYLRNHIKHQHAEMHKHEASFKVWLQDRIPSLGKPCKWCGNSYTSRTQHAVACTVLYQTCVFKKLVQSMGADHGGASNVYDHGLYGACRDQASSGNVLRSPTQQEDQERCG